LNPDLCTTIQASFSAYLDGAVSGHEMQQISRHLLGDEKNEGLADEGCKTGPCETCAREFAAWRHTQEALATLGPAKAPADLSLKLRLAISREQARRGSRLLDRLSLAWDNAVRPMLLQVSAGIAGTVVLVGGIMLLMGFVAPPPQVQANDEPLGAITAPHYLYSTAVPRSIVTGSNTAIIVEALVDSSGRVYDYNIVSGPQDDAVRTQVADQLLGSVFQPASVFGLPVRSRVVVTFSGISVHG
jgi:anti-sigma factor RsiW